VAGKKLPYNDRENDQSNATHRRAPRIQACSVSASNSAFHANSLFLFLLVVFN
jgi:hypothetical protein